MRNDGDFNPADAPHASEFLDQAVHAHADTKAAEDRFGEIMERSFGLESSPETKRDIEHRPESDGTPYGYDAPLDAENAREDRRTAAEKLDDGLERVFGTDKPERAQPKPQAEAPSEAPEVEDWRPADATEMIWTAQEAQLIGRCENERQQLDREIAEFNHHWEMLARLPDEQKAQYQSKLFAAREMLAQRIAAYDRAVKGLSDIATQRTRSQLEHRVASEAQKLQKALPDLDIAKTRTYGLSYGFSEQQIDSLMDHREVAILEKARRYDEMQQQQKQNKVVRRITRKTDDRSKLQRAQRTGNYDGTADALERRLGEIFR